MADTTFTAGTVVASTWLNDVNDFVYGNSDSVSINAYAGVDGTGAAECSAAINTALAALAADGVKTVRFPGTYKITSPITLFNNTTYILNGTINATVTEYAVLLPTTASKITVLGLGTGVIQGTMARGLSGVQFGTCTDVVVEGLTVTGATLVGAGYTSGMFFDGCTRVKVRFNYLYGNGIGVSTATGNCDIMFYVGVPGNTDCFVEGNVCRSTAVGFNLACYNFTDSTINANECYGAVCGSSNNNGYGILCYASGASPQVYRTQITNNRVQQTGGSGIYTASGNWLVVSGNILYTTALTQSDASLPAAAISMNGPTDSVVTNNTIYGGGKNGISWTSAVGGVVSNNRINGTTTAGIHIRGTCDRSQFTGNTIKGCSPNIYNDTSSTGLIITNNSAAQSGTGNHGVHLVSVSDSVISNNSFHTNARHGLAVLAGARNTITGNIALDNGSDTGNTYDGIANQSTQSVVANNRCSNNATSNQRYGVTSSGDYCSITNNNCIGNATDGFNLSGTAIFKEGNRYTSGVIAGTATLVAGAVTLNTIEARTGDDIVLTCTTFGGTPGFVRKSATVSGTSHTLTSNNGADTSTFQWRIVH